MAVRILKNLTASEAEIPDLGITSPNGVPAGEQKDLIGDYGLTMVELSNSNDLVLLLGQGTGSFVINDDSRDYGVGEGIDLVRNIPQRFPLATYDNRPLVRADSRPISYKNYFTEVGDDADVSPYIGNGKPMWWDWSDGTTDVITDPGPALPIPSNMKRKRIKFKFSEPIYLKEGALYFHGAAKGSFVDMYIVCLAGQYYIDPSTGAPTQASEDVIVAHYCSRLHFQGDCPMGDEFNSEGCTESSIPSNYEWWLDVTVPDSDSSSTGYVELEIYRPHTVLLPGESLTT